MTDSAFIENRTFDEIQVGETASVSRTLSEKDIQLFALVSGDVNPAHLDADFAQTDFFQRIIAHGMWGGGPISASRCASPFPSASATSSPHPSR